MRNDTTLVHPIIIADALRYAAKARN